MKNKIGWYAAGLLALALTARASVVVYNALLVNEAALAYDNTYAVDLQKTGIDSVSAQATYSSATVAAVTFRDGSQSTGSLTVLNYAALSTASATNQVTVVSNAGLAGAVLALPGFVFQEGLDWKAVDTTSGTAASLAAALAEVPSLHVSRVGSVVYATAPAVGAYYNSWQMASSTPAALAVAHPYFTGGQDNAIVKIGGVPLLQGRDFTAATSNAATATSLAAAVNAKAALNVYVAASAAGAVVTSTAVRNGTAYNFALASSSPTALSVSGARMTGGTNPADTLGSAVINIPAHGLTLALPVLYSTAGGTIGGLTNQTTYYAIPVDANSLKLASSQANALLGTGLVVSSTSTQTTAHVYTLTPTPIAGTPSFKWQVSNDGSSWIDLAVSSVTVSAYSNPPASTLWSFGFIGTRYLRLNVIAPTSGGLNLNVQLIGTN